MIQLNNLCKSYVVGNNKVNALKNVSVQFRSGEFVSVLGPSGCGKTTLLNLIGGLDRYDSGDIIINGKSTKDFKSGDWDAYRNHSVGFVFQSYNLIAHQSVLANVELALTIAGVPRAERRERAKNALLKVGLGNEFKKKPNQLSGGQMQRVAIARALINDPEILLADEPTGALDSETSVQVMELLKEIAKDRLVIMVTHNGDLAQQYSTRIIKLTDGTIVDDSNPCEFVEEQQQDCKRLKEKKPSMSLKTAFTLSLNNLLTKKGRTILTSFAGSIGIIGIALILALSSGFQSYINRAQEETLSTYPLTINQATIDGSIMLDMGSKGEEQVDMGRIYADCRLSEMFNTMRSNTHINDLKSLKEFIESDDCKIKDNSTVQYKYDLNLNFYLTNTENGVIMADSNEIIDRMYEVMNVQSPAEMLEGMSGFMGGLGSSLASQYNMWSELMDNQALLEQQYSLLAGKWPENYNEVVISVNENNYINDLYLYALGLKSRKQLEENLEKMKNGEELPIENISYSVDDILKLEYKLLLNTDLYAKENGIWVDKSTDSEFFKQAVDNSMTIKVVGIIKPAKGAIAQSMSGIIGYRPSLVQEVVERTNESQIVKEQNDNRDIDIFTGYKFYGEDIKTKWDSMATDEKWEIILPYLISNGPSGMDMTQLPSEAKEQLISQYGPTILESLGSYDSNMNKLGAIDINSPKQINIYATDFAAKDIIKSEIDRYNLKNKNSFDADGNSDKEIKYTDMLDLLLSTISTIIDAISYVLIAFVSISLIVSSIMIGVITYISVLERTKEIGILRAVGASKRDISRVFNAETFIIGFISGIMGIAVTLVLTIPINIFIHSVSGIANVAVLPLGGGLILVLISVVLTVIAGLVPSRTAAKKDPVVALRTE